MAHPVEPFSMNSAKRSFAVIFTHLGAFYARMGGFGTSVYRKRRRPRVLPLGRKG